MHGTIRLSPRDNVAVVRQSLKEIPAGHKIAIVNIPKGSEIIKYGQSIGKACVDIIDGQSDVQSKGTEIYLRILRAASGELTRSEILGHKEFVPWRIGPVM